MQIEIEEHPRTLPPPPLPKLQFARASVASRCFVWHKANDSANRKVREDKQSRAKMSEDQGDESIYELYSRLYNPLVRGDLDGRVSL